MRILYCCERTADRRLLKALAELHHVVEAADDLDDAAIRVGEGGWQAVVVDLGDPSATTIAAMRAAAPHALFIVIASDEPSGERVRLLRAGADCVFSRPYEVREISAVLDASVRRATRAPAAGAAPRLELSPTASAAVVDGEAIRLTPHEYGLLALLAGRPGEVLDASQIIQAVWGDEAEVTPRLVQAYVARLRAKLERGRPWRLLHAVRGHGYLFRIDPA